MQRDAKSGFFYKALMRGKRMFGWDAPFEEDPVPLCDVVFMKENAVSNGSLIPHPLSFTFQGKCVEYVRNPRKRSCRGKYLK
jgi:hypothetical protein